MSARAYSIGSWKLCTTPVSLLNFFLCVLYCMHNPPLRIMGSVVRDARASVEFFHNFFGREHRDI